MKKKSIVIGLVTLLSMSAIASAGELDGLTFCREVDCGVPGEVRGIWRHCVSFNNDEATDDGTSLFFSPPERYRYRLDGVSIINAETGHPTQYAIQGNDIVMTDSKDVLFRQD